MSREQILALEGRNLYNATRFHLFGLPPLNPEALYAADATLVASVEHEIRRRSIAQRLEGKPGQRVYEKYIWELADMLNIGDCGVAYLFSEWDCFRMMTASLEMVCRAAILAVIEEAT